MEYKENEIKKCPLCKKQYTGYPAISRKDNKTEICSDCGRKEAMLEFYRNFYNS